MNWFIHTVTLLKVAYQYRCFIGTRGALPCFVAATLEAEGEVFAVLYPRDAPVQLARRHGPELVPAHASFLAVSLYFDTMYV